MNVTHLLIGQACERPDAPAIVEGSGRRRRVITFAQLDHASAQAAAMLHADGLRAGDPVLVFVPMSIELYVTLIGIFRIGAAAVFLDPSAGRGHIAGCCERLPPVALVGVAKAHLLRLISPALRRVPRAYALSRWVPLAKRWRRRTAFVPYSEIAERTDDDAALVTFTSGSTGRPKAAVRTHGFLAAQHAALSRAIGLSPGHVDLSTLPVFTLANLASGVTSVIPDANLRRPGAIRPGPVLRQAAAENVTRCVASPAFLERLVGEPGAAEAMRRFDRLHTGGAPVFPKTLRRLQAAASEARVVAVYGSTEAEPIAEIDWRDVSDPDAAAMLAGRGLLAGAIVPDLRLRVIRDAWGTPLGAMTAAEFDALRRPAAVAGEIVVSGRHVLGGYLGGEGDAECKFRVDGVVWHRTGDTGYLDDRGRLWLLGRAAATIVDERGTLHPLAVECAAGEIDGVRRSALIAFDGRRLLAVEAERGRAAGLAGRVAAGLQAFHLDEVLLLLRIPVDKRHNAKTDYVRLRERIQRSHGRLASGKLCSNGRTDG